MTPWIVIIIAGAGTFLFRISLVAVFSSSEPPPWLEHASRHVAPAAFAGLAAVGLLAPVSGGISQAVPPLIAVAVTVAVALRSPTPVALAAGLPTLWLGSAVLNAA